MKLTAKKALTYCNKHWLVIEEILKTKGIQGRNGDDIKELALNKMGFEVNNLPRNLCFCCEASSTEFPTEDCGRTCPIQWSNGHCLEGEFNDWCNAVEDEDNDLPEAIRLAHRIAEMAQEALDRRSK